MPPLDDAKPGLLVWREWLDSRLHDFVEWSISEHCPYCRAVLRQTSSDRAVEDVRYNDDHVDDATARYWLCGFCGWSWARWRSWHRGMPSITSDRWSAQRALRRFSLSDPRVSLAELATHLQRNYSDIAAISPRRFEELVAEVFRLQGWQVALTAASADGGVDIYLLRRWSDEHAIVECKRYQRKVSIGIVDRLLGVQLATGIRTAYLVTTSEFSKPAIGRATSPAIAQFGFSLSLVDCRNLLELLGAFNDPVPPPEIWSQLLAEGLLSNRVDR